MSQQQILRDALDIALNLANAEVASLQQSLGDRLPLKHKTAADDVRTIESAIAAIATADAEGAPDAVVEANRELLRQRSEVGMRKYGVPLANTSLTERELTTHALEEALDLANYLQAMLQRAARPAPVGAVQAKLDMADERTRFEEWAGNPPVEIEDIDADPESFWCWQAWQAALGLSPSVRGPAAAPAAPIVAESEQATHRRCYAGIREAHFKPEPDVSIPAPKIDTSPGRVDSVKVEQAKPVPSCPLRGTACGQLPTAWCATCPKWGSYLEQVKHVEGSDELFELSMGGLTLDEDDISFAHGVWTAAWRARGQQAGAVDGELADGYEGGTMTSAAPGRGSTIRLHYTSAAQGESAFCAISNMIDAANKRAASANQKGE